MLKKITLGSLFALSIAFLTAGPVSAHATSAKKAPVPTAPQGFCWPAGMHC